jgi:hypothetical protein
VIKRRNSIDGQFAAHTIEMIKSPAWSVLSLSARRVLDRIEIEHADHGGYDNGRLPVTYDDFERFGIHRHAIRAAIQETVALGFSEITERGRAGNAEFRSPHKFRVTYFPVGRAPPTNEWQRIKTVEEAQTRARAARRKAPQKTKLQWRKTPNLSVLCCSSEACTDGLSGTGSRRTGNLAKIGRDERSKLASCVRHRADLDIAARLAR